MSGSRKNNEHINSQNGNVETEPSKMPIIIVNQLANRLNLAIRLTPEPLSFSDLPIEVIGEIVGKLDLKDRLRTRKVSRTLRTVVDKQKAYFDKIHISFDSSEITIWFDKHWVIYRNRQNECSVESQPDVFVPSKETLVKCHFLDAALNDLAIALKKPKFELGKLVLSFEGKTDKKAEKFLKFFESLRSPMHVEHLSFFNGRAEHVLPILSELKPGTLEEINLGFMKTNVIANQLVKTDQWKQAKYFSIYTPMPVGLENFLHFKVFNVSIESISADDVIFLRENLSNCANFKSCALSVCQSNISISVIKQIREKFAAGVIIPSHQAALISSISHRHPIPGTNEHLWFWITSRKLSIQRTD